MDKAAISNAVYAATLHLTEGVIEGGFGERINGHHWAQDVVAAVLAQLDGDNGPMKKHGLRCAELAERVRKERG